VNPSGCSELCYDRAACVVRRQFIPEIRALEPVTTAIPLGIVLGITGIKDLIDDIVS